MAKVIFSAAATEKKSKGLPMFWSEELGWTTLGSATIYPENSTEQYPSHDAIWIKLPPLHEIEIGDDIWVIGRSEDHENTLQINISNNGEGISVDVWAGGERTRESLTSTWATFNEADSEL